MEIKTTTEIYVQHNKDCNSYGFGEINGMTKKVFYGECKKKWVAVDELLDNMSQIANMPHYNTSNEVHQYLKDIEKLLKN